MKNNYGISQIVKRATDWVSGASGITYEDRKVDWSKYLPDPEKQGFPAFDTQGCVSFSLTNIIETQCNYLWTTDCWNVEQKKEMEALKVVKDGRFNFSDRFVVVGSDTTKKGNQMQTVLDFVRKNGLVAEEVYPNPATQTWDEYYKEIPADIYVQAQKMLQYLTLSYEWTVQGKEDLDAIKKHVKQAPLQVATAICGDWYSESIKSCNLTQPMHAYTIYGVEEHINVFDHYVPFNKKLTLDYPILWALKVVVEPVKKQIFTSDLYFGVRSPQVFQLQRLYKKLGFATYEPTGYFGLMTWMSTVAFQKAYGITPTHGFVGPVTRKQLEKISTGIL